MEATSHELHFNVTREHELYFIFSGFTRYLNDSHDMDMPPSQADYCTITITLLWMTSLSSTLFILSMTFERFYSIIRPHKSASFNTIGRAKTIILCTVMVSVVYNLPHIFITTSDGRRCGAFGKALKTGIGKFYYWFSAVLE